MTLSTTPGGISDPAALSKRSPVSTETFDGIALLVLDNPPVNTLGRSVRSALIDALEHAERSTAITAVVLAGRGGLFSAGADLAEFDSGEGLAEPSLHRTILGFLDTMSKPVVAAISGTALGGGLELALGCHYRVISSDALIGLPESTFGFLPGAGGTQRLPRAIGLEPALNLMIGGRKIPAAEFAGTRLVDLLVEGDVIEAALSFARTVADRDIPRLRDLDVEHDYLQPFLAFVARSLATSGTAPAGGTAIAAAIAAGPTRTTFDRGIATEFDLFERLAARPIARAIRYRFFAERAAGKLEPAAEQAARPVSTAAVIGAGTMGRGIALAFLGAGVDVTLIDADPLALEFARKYVNEELRIGGARAPVRPGSVREAGAFAVASDVAGARDADLIVEAVFENMEVKKAVFANLDRIAKAGAVLATNTSSLDVDEIAQATSRPSDVVGMHFFSPAQVMRLVEVVRGRASSVSTLVTVIEVVRRLGKLPVVARVGDGFIGNRLMDQYVRQAMQLLHEGALPEQVDRALEAWGFRMGPFRVLDLVGNDVPAHARAERGDDGSDWDIADELVRRGWLGRKTGRGWYRYGERGQASTDQQVTRIIRSRAHGGTAMREFDDDEIVDRCVYALVNEGAAALREGIARRASDVDVVMMNGYGFPATRGGPLFAADEAGLSNVVRRMRQFQATCPSHPEFWEPDPLLLSLLKSDLLLSGWRSSGD